MTMHRTIFWSWQSDLPNSTNRGFIGEALEQAARAIRDDDSIAVEPVIDRDTRGVGGSPDIANTILSKIDEADVFVCDVTFVNAQSPDAERLTPNPNVLVELGYAMKTLSPENVLMVFNKAYGNGDPKNLPFDIRGRRVVTYEMSEDNSDRAPVRRALAAWLKEGLLDILTKLDTAANKASQAQLQSFRDQRIAQIVATDTPANLDGTAMVALHLVPLAARDVGSRFDLSELIAGGMLNEARLLDQRYNWFDHRANHDGFLVTDARRGERCASYLQVFHSGALESVATLGSEQGTAIPAAYFEGKVIETLGAYLRLYSRLGVGLPVGVMLSLLGVRGYWLRENPSAVRIMEQLLPIDRDQLLMQPIIATDYGADADTLLRESFDAIWQTVGAPRSPNYGPDGRWNPR